MITKNDIHSFFSYSQQSTQDTVFPHSAVTMSLATVTVLAVLASSVSGLIHEVNTDPGEDNNKQIPHFLPLAFPLPNGNASTCQALCKMSPDCQYFVFMNIGYDDYYPSGTCHFGKR